MMPLTEYQAQRVPTIKGFISACAKCNKAVYHESPLPDETYCPYCGATIRNRKKYPVKTPINKQGDILFNGNHQFLYVFNGRYGVGVSASPEPDHSVSFVWVPCKRTNLKPGDTAYRSRFDELDFADPMGACKVLDDDFHVFIRDDGSALVRGNDAEYWFKLVRKDK